MANEWVNLDYIFVRGGNWRVGAEMAGRDVETVMAGWTDFSSGGVGENRADSDWSSLTGDRVLGRLAVVMYIPPCC